MRRAILTISLHLVVVCSFAFTDTLYLIRDSIEIEQLMVSQTTFCQENEFDLQNVVLRVGVNENVELLIANTDLIDHTFTIDGVVNQILPTSLTSIVNFQITEPGTYRYYSSIDQGRLIGASGIIQVGYENETSFFWNLNDINSSLSHELSDGSQNVIPSEYDPDIFTINGFAFPSTVDDTTGYVVGSVGEEIIISILNSGNMEHVLHFHGYHVEILDAQIYTKQVGWLKDTFPLKKGDGLTVKLIPHQPGVFPVHDHNLIAVTNAGFYPGGMITQLNISP
ncbi:MAG: multicopper oxidase domain-containing protein [Flavobacteriales bacterium]|nr:multicopper oxidase domain-containing protein [Flavobacteriales bacterium]